MKTPRSRIRSKRASGVLVALLVAGCVGTPQTAGTPVDIAALRAQSADGFGLRFQSGGGFWFQSDGSGSYVVAAQGGRLLTLDSTLTQADSGQLCLGPNGENWGGGCVSIVDTETGRTCPHEFRTGFSRVRDCTVVTERWF